MTEGDKEFVNCMTKKIESLFKIKPYKVGDREYIPFYMGQKLLLDIMVTEFLKVDTMQKQINFFRDLYDLEKKSIEEMERNKCKT